MGSLVAGGATVIASLFHDLIQLFLQSGFVGSKSLLLRGRALARMRWNLRRIRFLELELDIVLHLTLLLLQRLLLCFLRGLAGSSDLLSCSLLFCSLLRRCGSSFSFGLGSNESLTIVAECSVASDVLRKLSMLSEARVEVVLGRGLVDAEALMTDICTVEYTRPSFPMYHGAVFHDADHIGGLVTMCEPKDAVHGTTGISAHTRVFGDGEGVRSTKAVAGAGEALEHDDHLTFRKIVHGGEVVFLVSNWVVGGETLVELLQYLLHLRVSQYCRQLRLDVGLMELHLECAGDVRVQDIGDGD